MSSIVLDIELANKNVTKELGILLMAKIRDTQLVLQKSTKPQNKRFGAQETCTELCRTVDVWITMSFRTFSRDLKTVNTLQREEKKSRFLAIY